MATIAELKAKLSADVGEFVAGMAASNSALSGFATKSTLVGGGLLLLGAGALALGRQALNMGMEFDAALDSIQTKTGATGTKLAALGESTRAVFRSIPTDLGLAAEAIGTVNQRLGLMGPPLETVSKQFLELSRITGTDLKTNMQAGTDALLKWNVSAAQIPGMLDMLFRASQQSGASFQRLADLVTRNAAVLQQFGFTLPEAIALMAAFEKGGINTELAMTGLRNALAQFAAAGVTDAKQALTDTFNAIKNAPSDIIATQIAIDTFGRRAGPELAAAIRSGKFDLDAMLSAIKDGQPGILETANSTNDFSEKLQILKNNLNDLLIPLGTVLFDALNATIPVLTLVVSGIAQLTDALGKLPGPIQAAFQVAFTPAMAVLQNAPAVIEGARGAIERIRDAFTGFGAALTVVQSAVTTAILSIVTDFLNLYGAVTASVSSLASSVKEAFVALRIALESTAGLIYTKIKTQFDNAKTAAVDAVNTLKDTVNEAFRNLSNDINSKVNLIKENITNRFSDAKTNAVNHVVQLASSVVSALDGLVNTAYNAANAVGVAIVSGIRNGVEALAQTALDAISNFVQRMLDLIAKISVIASPSKVTTYMGEMIGLGMVRGIESMVPDAAAAAASLADASLPSMDAVGFDAAASRSNGQPTYISISLKSQELVDLIRNAEAGGEFSRHFGAQMGLYAGTP